LDQGPSSIGPIAEIPPTDLERIKESIPIFASTLADSVGELFPAQSSPSSPGKSNKSNLKPPPAASLSNDVPLSILRPDKFARSQYFNSGIIRNKKQFPHDSSPDMGSDKQLAEELFGDSKPPAVNSTAIRPKDILAEAPEQGKNTSPSSSHESHPAAPNIDVVESLNQSIFEKQAQLAKLQSPIDALTQESGVYEDVEMTDDAFTLVQHHKRFEAGVSNKPSILKPNSIAQQGDDSRPARPGSHPTHVPRVRSSRARDRRP
jgi:hypothetical protein